MAYKLGLQVRKILQVRKTSLKKWFRVLIRSSPIRNHPADPIQPCGRSAAHQIAFRSVCLIFQLRFFKNCKHKILIKNFQDSVGYRVYATDSCEESPWGCSQPGQILTCKSTLQLVNWDLQLVNVTCKTFGNHSWKRYWVIVWDYNSS